MLPANDVEVVPDERTFVSHYNYLVTNQQSSDIFGFNRGAQSKKQESIQFELQMKLFMLWLKMTYQSSVVLQKLNHV